MSLSLSLIPLTVKIPEDILMEILARLPADSVTRFKCVSKLWNSLISSRYFTNLFVKFSTKRAFVYTYDFEGNCMLFSSRLIKLDATTSFVQLNRDLTLPCLNKDCWNMFQNAIRGLMCFRMDRVYGVSQIHIINFTTRQVLSLPLVESNMFLEKGDYSVRNYFGYDPVNDEYKVLNTNSSRSNELLSETQIFVLGDGASWRNTKSLTFPPPPHDPDGAGIFINNVLYYGARARSHEERSVLLRFDFNSEEFHLIELPEENRIKIINLMNFRGQVALLDCSRLNAKYTLDLWVAEDAGKSKWSHKVFVLPCHQIRVSLELKDIDVLDIRGTSRNGEVTLCAKYEYENRNDKSTHVVYDLENNRITRGFFTDPPYPGYSFFQTDIWEDVESIMYLEP